MITALSRRCETLVRVGLTPILRITLLVTLGLTGCNKLTSGGSSPTAPTTPPAAGSTISYTAIGASDTMGHGSSRECLPYDNQCAGLGYVQVAARQLRAQGFTVNLANLGLPTAVIGRDFQDLGQQYGRVIA